MISIKENDIDTRWIKTPRNSGSLDVSLGDAQTYVLANRDS